MRQSTNADGRKVAAATLCGNAQRQKCEQQMAEHALRYTPCHHRFIRSNFAIDSGYSSRMRPIHSILLSITVFMGCAPDNTSAQDIDPDCPEVSAAFVSSCKRVLSDTTGRFFNDYPAPIPLTCELLGMLQEELKDDSVRYHFEHLHQRYGDPRASAAFTFIKRHIDFPLAMALTTHWNPDTRIEAVEAVNNYRRIRPMVCATQEHYAQLEEQDRAAVRYFLRVLETTPMYINGSENSTIHSIYMQTVMHTLDRFTGQEHSTTGDMHRRLDMTEARLQQAIADWRKWLER